MAERRMFTKKVTDDDNFMALSSSAQALYLHLSMSADDDGFCNQVSICMFKAHASVQDLESLLEKRYIYQFQNGVIVIKHWRMANALRKDRYTPTAFQEELKKLELKDNGSYTMTQHNSLEDGGQTETIRQAAYKESDLPYSFDYKIRNAFYGRPCPICGALMEKECKDGIVTSNRTPTIQHNFPISKGGKHELGNISVICRQCNVSIKDQETGELNSKEVISEWDKIVGCRSVADCLPQVSIGKDSIDKDRITPLNPPAGETVEIPFSGELREAFDDWIAYKQEKRQPYKPRGLKTLITQTQNYVDKYGEKAVIGVIHDSMASNYQGITFERLTKMKPIEQPKQYTTKGSFFDDD